MLTLWLAKRTPFIWLTHCHFQSLSLLKCLSYESMSYGYQLFYSIAIPVSYSVCSCILNCCNILNLWPVAYLYLFNWHYRVLKLISWSVFLIGTSFINGKSRIILQSYLTFTRMLKNLIFFHIFSLPYKFVFHFGFNLAAFVN